MIDWQLPWENPFEGVHEAYDEDGDDAEDVEGEGLDDSGVVQLDLPDNLEADEAGYVAS